MKFLKTSANRIVLCLLLPVILLFTNQKPVSAKVLTAKNYQENPDGMGVVLLSVNWGRQWGCGKYDNAQLVNLKFELFPENDNGEAADGFSVLELKSPSRLFVDPVFLNYGFIVKPGQYAMTGFSLKVANTRPMNVGYFNAEKKDLIKEGKSEGGTFTVGAGEAVYIGNFFLDCYENPIPWRYYTVGQDAFLKHASEFKQQYKFLKDKEVVYRLFKTKNFGQDYELPVEGEEGNGAGSVP